MNRLSPRTRQLVRKIFPDDIGTVERMLAEECGQNLPFCTDRDEFELERLRFAALKISEGSLVKLQAAVEQAKTDWRDELVWAGFAEHLAAHDYWADALLHDESSPGKG